MSRPAYMLTMDPASPHASFSTNVLRKIGFKVVHVKPEPKNDPVVSNKVSMQGIYRRIVESGEYSYVFEDYINTHEDIALSEIMLYENLSDRFFYLGVCTYGDCEITKKLRMESIMGKNVWVVSQGIRGLHAIGISPLGAKEMIEMSEQDDEKYMDVILEKYCNKHPANVVRYDKESYIYGHRGILFQDCKRFRLQ